jgi:hypothetical protein
MAGIMDASLNMRSRMQNYVVFKCCFVILDKKYIMYIIGA